MMTYDYGILIYKNINYKIKCMYGKNSEVILKRRIIKYEKNETG